MIAVKFEEKEKIGLQYALETLHGCSPFGQERIRRLRFYAPEERAALEEELYNVEQAANAAGELKDVYNKLMTGLCQMKDIRNSLRRCAAGETPDHVELFEIKGYLQRLDGMRPLFEQINAVTHFKGMTFHEVKDALAVLDPDGTGSRGFYIPDSATAKLKEIRSAKKEVEERLFHAQTDAEKDDLRLKRTRLCGEEDAEEMHVRKAMGAALAPMVDDLLSDAETAGRLDFIIQKALFAVRYGGVKPELTEKDLELEDQSGDLRPAGAAGPPLRAGIHLPDARGHGHHRRQHGRKVRGHEDGGAERAAAAGGLPGVRQKSPYAAVPQREDAL